MNGVINGVKYGKDAEGKTAVLNISHFHKEDGVEKEEVFDVYYSNRATRFYNI